MDNTAIRMKSCPKSNFPDDLWLDILSRLPVRSLVRFRYVSRLWRDLIDHPDLVHSHLTHFSNNRHESHLLIVEKVGRECVVRCSKTFKTDIPSSHTLPSFEGAEHWFVASTIDGLFMLEGGYDLRAARVLMLWNPSIRKFRRVPPFGEISKQMYMEDLCLGFDPLSRHYKYVTLVQTPVTGFQFVAVYTVETNSWKRVDLRGEGFSRCFNIVGGRGLCFRGALYALNYISEHLELISFYMRSETLAGSTNLPPEFELVSNFPVLTLAGGGSSVALVHLTGIAGFIWFLQGTEGDVNSLNWTKRYSFTFRIPSRCELDFLYLKKNGEVLLDGDKTVISYNLETHEKKIMIENTSLYKAKAWVYIESLILLN